MSMRWVLTWTPSDEHPHGRKAKARKVTEKRHGIELLGLIGSVEEHDTDLRWCHSDIHLADGVTKKKMSCGILSFLRTPRWKRVLDTT